MGQYIPSSENEQREMLLTLGLNSQEDLFKSIPEKVKLKKLNIPQGISELEVKEKIEEISEENKIFKSIFRGAGAYNHYIPSIVKAVTSKEEFLTAYTPYQAEISQGILQSIFEYQTMICELTGMDVSNASVYDGATAAAEAIAMCNERKRKKTLISSTIHPHVMETISTYCKGNETEIIIVPEKNGKTDVDSLTNLFDDSVSCVYIQQPNFNGLFEDVTHVAQLTHSKGAKLIMGCNPIALAIMKTPFECGADIAVGEGQPLGMPLSFGGPYLGFMACTKEMLRKLPGRIVGETVDKNGKRAFVLTLQAREQHIRREKAISNICSNQALCALTASVYMAAMGSSGMREVATQCMSKAKYLADELCKIDGIKLKYPGEFFNEFITECIIDTDVLLSELENHGILGGYPVKDGILWCATEMNSKCQIDEMISIVREAMKK